METEKCDIYEAKINVNRIVQKKQRKLIIFKTGCIIVFL